MEFAFVWMLFTHEDHNININLNIVVLSDINENLKGSTVRVTLNILGNSKDYLVRRFNFRQDKQ